MVDAINAQLDKSANRSRSNGDDCDGNSGGDRGGGSSSSGGDPKQDRNEGDDGGGEKSRGLGKIRVFDVVRVTRGFDAKNSCNQRRYHYLMPSFMLMPPAELEAAGAAATEAAEEPAAPHAAAAEEDGDSRRHLEEAKNADAPTARPGGEAGLGERSGGVGLVEVCEGHDAGELGGGFLSSAKERPPSLPPAVLDGIARRLAAFRLEERPPPPRQQRRPSPSPQRYPHRRRRRPSLPWTTKSPRERRRRR